MSACCRAGCQSRCRAKSEKALSRLDFSLSDNHDNQDFKEKVNSKAEEKSNSYGLCNPVIDENGVTTWDCVYFGNYPQSMYKPKNIPENLESGKEYTDSDGSRMVYEEWECKEYDKEDDEYKKVKQQLDEAKEMLNDPELKDLAEMDYLD